MEKLNITTTSNTLNFKIKDYRPLDNSYDVDVKCNSLDTETNREIETIYSYSSLSTEELKNLLSSKSTSDSSLELQTNTFVYRGLLKEYLPYVDKDSSEFKNYLDSTIPQDLETKPFTFKGLDVKCLTIEYIQSQRDYLYKINLEALDDELSTYSIQSYENKEVLQKFLLQLISEAKNPFDIPFKCINKGNVISDNLKEYLYNIGGTDIPKKNFSEGGSYDLKDKYIEYITIDENGESHSLITIETEEFSQYSPDLRLTRTKVLNNSDVKEYLSNINKSVLNKDSVDIYFFYEGKRYVTDIQTYIHLYDNKKELINSIIKYLNSDE